MQSGVGGSGGAIILQNVSVCGVNVYLLEVVLIDWLMFRYHVEAIHSFYDLFISLLILIVGLIPFTF